MKRTSRYWYPGLILLSVFWFSGNADGRTSLDSVLQPYLSSYDLPAVAAGVVRDGKVIAAGAVGTRRVGTHIPVTLQDRFHIGSDTKAMTALMAAMLVEEGKLRWDTAVAEVFPELAEEMDPRLRRVTLEQLLSHTSGIPKDNEEIIKSYLEAMTQDGNLDAARYWLVRQMSRRPLEFEPGTGFAYSNTGYVFVGAMIERLEKTTWEEAITRRVFIPLQLKTAGLGPQASMGKIDAPVGHAVVDGRPQALLAGPNGDVPPVMGPAGTVHLSVLDFARWAGWNAGEGKCKPALVKPETLRKLHTPVISTPEKKDAAPGTPRGGKYALGWGWMTVDWAPYPLLYHGGSNSMNLAHVWIDPQRDLAMVFVTNIGGPKADAALLHLAHKLYSKYGRKGIGPLSTTGR
ncbi:MAG TPA: serine hydrolase domain-containing protein [Syntrophobacteraceae bacterium]|nr:serine hydrolase domain-containing protein [Syntrophobacteraceae bacterium]